LDESALSGTVNECDSAYEYMTVFSNSQVDKSTFRIRMISEHVLDNLSTNHSSMWGHWGYSFDALPDAPHHDDGDRERQLAEPELVHWRCSIRTEFEANFLAPMELRMMSSKSNIREVLFRP
jgi:hypothetical protein